MVAPDYKNIEISVQIVDDVAQYTVTESDGAGGWKELQTKQGVSFRPAQATSAKQAADFIAIALQVTEPGIRDRILERVIEEVHRVAFDGPFWDHKWDLVCSMHTGKRVDDIFKCMCGEHKIVWRETRPA